MDRLNRGFRVVFKTFQSRQQYSVTRHQFDDGRRRRNLVVAVIVLSVLLLIVIGVAVWLMLIDKDGNSVDDKSDLEILRQHKTETEAQVKGWKQEIYELKKNAGKGYTPSRLFDKTSERGYIMHELVRKFADMKNLSLVQLQANIDHQATFRTVLGNICPAETSCDEESRKSPYRTLDGSCNNLYHPEWGMIGRPQKRSLPAMYSDDLGSPRLYGTDGEPLPSPRMVSNVVHSPGRAGRIDEHTTVMVMAFGQFLSHDIVSTPMMDGHHSSVIKCCEKGPAALLSGPFKACFPIAVARDDPHFHDSSCMTFTRSAPAVCDKCEICGRDQINEMTSYIDASQVYGATFNTSSRLRMHSGGLLLENENGLLPEKKGGNCKIMKQHQYCFSAGDGRVNVVPNLSTLHTVFVRLHNQLAQKLSEINPHWDDEKLYQESRKILIAIMQNMVYNEYLPVILGKHYMTTYNLSTGSGFEAVYDSTIDATSSNGFNTAAFRFGHVTVPREQISLDDGYKPECITRIERTYHTTNMTFLYSAGLTRWMVHRRGIRTDGSFDEGVRNLLFLDRKKSFDLASLNIQRGRDHGLPSFNHYRKFCKLPAITENEFRRKGTAMGDFAVEVANLYRKVYRSPDDIDLFSGGVKETISPGAQVGPTFACLLAHEFRHLKVGDRFYFENPRADTGFTISQLMTIKELSFAKVLCETMKISEIQPEVFRPVTEQNPLMKCQQLPEIRLDLWRDVSK